MSRDRQLIGLCPQCSAKDLACSYNHFDRDGLTIDSWEHKCTNCGFRETRAFRSDEEEWKEEIDDPARCPYCQRAPS